MIVSIKGTAFLDVLVEICPLLSSFTLALAFVCPCFGPAEYLLYHTFPIALASLKPVFGFCFPLLWPCSALALCYVSPQSGPSAAFCWPLFPVPLALLQPCFSPATSLGTVRRVSFCFFFFVV